MACRMIRIGTLMILFATVHSRTVWQSPANNARENSYDLTDEGASPQEYSFLKPLPIPHDLAEMLDLRGDKIMSKQQRLLKRFDALRNGGVLGSQKRSASPWRLFHTYPDPQMYK